MTVFDDDKFTMIFLRVLAVILIWISIMFVFRVQDEMRDFDQDETAGIEVIYLSYEESKRIRWPHHTDSLVLFFYDYENCYIEPEVYNTSVLEKIRLIAPGTTIRMRVVPDTDAILEIEANGEKIIEYEDSMKKRHREAVFSVVFIPVILCMALLLFRVSQNIKNGKHRYVRYKRK